MPAPRRLREEALRIADAGDGMHALAREIAQRAPPRRIRQCHRRVATQAHGNFAGLGRAAVADTKIHAGEPRHRFAQRSGRQQAAIAEAAFAVDHADFHIAVQPVMLQTVIGNDHIDIDLSQQYLTNGGGAIPADRDRRAAWRDGSGRLRRRPIPASSAHRAAMGSRADPP